MIVGRELVDVCFLRRALCAAPNKEILSLSSVQGSSIGESRMANAFKAQCCKQRCRGEDRMAGALVIITIVQVNKAFNSIRAAFCVTASMPLLFPVEFVPVYRALFLRQRQALMESLPLL